MFDLRTSPFYLLGVSPRDNRAIIAQATETAIAEGMLDESVATRAQQILMSPRLRLGAELGWLVGLAPNRVRQIIENIRLDENTVASLPLIAGANLAAHRCSSHTSPAHHELFFRFYAQRNDNEILSLIKRPHPAGRAVAADQEEELLRGEMGQLVKADQCNLRALPLVDCGV